MLLSGFCYVCHVFPPLVSIFGLFPAPLSWKRLLRDPVRAPDVMSCPEEASASELSPGGLPVPVGCPVPVCLALEGCPVPVFSCLSSPGGLLIPPNFPREIFLGGRRIPAGVGL